MKIGYKTCISCEYHRDSLAGKLDEGTCHFNPPTAIFYGGSVEAEFPPVANEDWCSKWKERIINL